MGAALYLVTMALLEDAPSLTLAPTAILLGAFLVPVVYVVFVYETHSYYDLPVSTVALVFLVGGVLGVLGAAVLAERVSLSFGLLSFVLLALAEEAAKVASVVALVRRPRLRTARHGFLLGAAVGMGFAAFETMGYAMRFMIESDGSLDLVSRVLLTRGLLSPLAHGTWSALVLGVLWRERRRVTRASSAAFGAAVALHVLWNWAGSSIPLEVALPGFSARWRFVDLTVPELSLPLPSLLVGALGLWLVRLVAVRGHQPDAAEPGSAAEDRAAR